MTPPSHGGGLQFDSGCLYYYLCVNIAQFNVVPVLVQQKNQYMPKPSDKPLHYWRSALTNRAKWALCQKHHALTSSNILHKKMRPNVLSMTTERNSRTQRTWCARIIEAIYNTLLANIFSNITTMTFQKRINIWTEYLFLSHLKQMRLSTRVLTVLRTSTRHDIINYDE